jgi:hypothetical protein
MVWDAEFEHWMVVWCFEFAPNGWWRNALILHPMAGAMLGKGLKAVRTMICTHQRKQYSDKCLLAQQRNLSACWHEQCACWHEWWDAEHLPVQTMVCWVPVGTHSGMRKAENEHPIAVQSWKSMPYGGARLKMSAEWQRKAEILHLMVAGGWIWAPDGSPNLKVSAQWQWEAEKKHPMVVWCLEKAKLWACSLKNEHSWLWDGRDESKH